MWGAHDGVGFDGRQRRAAGVEFISALMNHSALGSHPVALTLAWTFRRIHRFACASPPGKGDAVVTIHPKRGYWNSASIAFERPTPRVAEASANAHWK